MRIDTRDRVNWGAASLAAAICIGMVATPAQGQQARAIIDGTVLVDGQTHFIQGTVIEIGGPSGPVSATGTFLMDENDPPQTAPPLTDWTAFAVASWPKGAIGIQFVLTQVGDSGRVHINLGQFGQLDDEFQVVSTSPFTFHHQVSGEITRLARAELPVERTGFRFVWSPAGSVTGHELLRAHVGPSTVEIPATYEGTFQAAAPSLPLPARFTGGYAQHTLDAATGKWSGNGARQVQLLSGVQPSFFEPGRFEMELFADLAPFGPLVRAFFMMISDGSRGFPPGLILTSPFSAGPDNIFLVSGPGDVGVLAAGFADPKSTAFSQGAYGQGLLVAEASGERILRLLPDGTRTTFADLGSPPAPHMYGPTGLAYGDDDLLYASDFLSGEILRVQPDGKSDVFALVPLPPSGPVPPGSFVVAGAKAMHHDPESRYGGTFIAGTFSVPVGPTPTFFSSDVLYSVSADGGDVIPLVGGLSAAEEPVLGPGAAFGADLYVPTLGSDFPGDGTLFTFSPDGRLRPFMTQVDATHVVFDTTGVLGGGMFVAEFGNHGSGRVWHVRPAPGTVAGDVGPTLRLQKSGNVITLTWGVSCVNTDVDYAIYEGQIGQFSNRVPLTCSTNGFTNYTLGPSNTNRYYLVVPHNGAIEGSYGQSSAGERTPSKVACRPQSLGVPVCP